MCPYISAPFLACSIYFIEWSEMRDFWVCGRLSIKFQQPQNFGFLNLTIVSDGTIVSGDSFSSQTIAGWWFGTVINNGY